jgi:hypothetical protein
MAELTLISTLILVIWLGWCFAAFANWIFNGTRNEDQVERWFVSVIITGVISCIVIKAIEGH